MSTDERLRKAGGIRRPVILLGTVFTIFYIALGLFILFDKQNRLHIPVDFKNIFAGMLLVYGIYRGWRVWSDNRA
jgi:hypothetical protein